MMGHSSRNAFGDASFTAPTAPQTSQSLAVLPACPHADSESTCPNHHFGQCCSSENLQHVSAADHHLPNSRDFNALAATLRAELAPKTRIEEILVDRVILAAYRLDQITREEYQAIDAPEGLPEITRDTLRVEASLETALALLESARRTRTPRWGHADHPAQKVELEPETPSFPDDFDGLGDADFSNEWPIVEDEPHDVPSCDDHEADDEPMPIRWQDRLVIDPNVSTTSPVVKGTWVTVQHVTTLVVDGWTWSDILRTHPELTEDDIRTCLAYTVELDDQGAY